MTKPTIAAVAIAFVALSAVAAWRLYNAEQECKQLGRELWITEYSELRCLAPSADDLSAE